MPRETEHGPYRTVALPSDVDEALLQFAAENTEGNVAAALRLIVQQTLSRRGGLSGLSGDLERAGYRDAAMKAKRDVFAAVATAVNEVIEQNEG